LQQAPGLRTHDRPFAFTTHTIAARMNVRRITMYLHTGDVLVIGFFGVLSLINVAFASRIPYWWQIVLINFAVSALICWLGYARAKTGSTVLRRIHEWYVPPLVFFSFKELYYMIYPIHHGLDYDDWLIAADRWLFGVNPTEWLMQFSHPVLTEVLQIAYTSFYFLFIIVGYEFYKKKQIDYFLFFMFTSMYGFFLSYLGYFCLPAVGPRFTLHDFATLDYELPGLLLTPYLRWFVNVGESIPLGVSSAISMAGTQRDVFPSGHTMMTLVVMYLSARWKVRARYLVYSVGTLLIIATVYQRYHYVIDLIAGAIFALVCIITARPLYAFIKRRCNTIENRLPPEETGRHLDSIGIGF
jgi:membrane-associated phospholipid phosphatase